MLNNIYLEKIINKVNIILSKYSVLADKKEKKRHNQLNRFVKYGWAITFETYYLLDLDLKTKKDINTYMERLYTKKQVKDIIEYINSKLKNKNLKTYFKESVLCYNNNQYLSSSMLIFPIIENILNTQFICNTSKLTGGNLSTEFKKKIEKNYTIVDDIMTCIFILFDKYFKSAENFNLRQNILNRNIVTHGYQYRAIKKYECIQLYIVLYNLIFILNNKGVYL